MNIDSSNNETMTINNLLYIPGYAGVPNLYSPKVMLLKEFITNVSVLNTGGEYTSDAYMTAAKDPYPDFSFDVFCGTSLGGYWAWRFAQKSQKPFILLNPVVDPFNQLQWIASKNERETYRGHEMPSERSSSSSLSVPGLVILSKNDPVLDARMAMDAFDGIASVVVLENSSSHSMDSDGDINAIRTHIRDALTKDFQRIAV